MQRDSDEEDLSDEEESVHGKESGKDPVERLIWVLHPESETSFSREDREGREEGGV